jgi:hypothetical protein
MALQKQGGGLGSILCGEIWRRCFASLAVHATPVRYQAAKILTSTYETSFKRQVSWMVLHTAPKFSRFFMTLETSDVTDAEVIIKIDISNAFNTACRALTLDVLSGYTVLVGSNTRTLLSALERPYPTCLLTVTPCVHAMLSYDALTGMHSFTWRRANGGDSTATP